MKIRLKAACVLLAAAMLLCGCSLQLSFEDSDSENVVSADENAVESGSTVDAAVSIIQYMNNTPLNECCEGVKEALESAGIAYDVTVGGMHTERDDCEEKARELAINGKSNLIICIGTQCAEAVVPIINSADRTPVVFCAVTDPVGAGLVENITAPGVNCTGVATAFNISEQLNMINTFQPSITRLGVIYTESEQNTDQQLKSLRKAAKKLGITVYEAAVEDPSQLSSAATELMRKTEAVTLLPDNMIAANSWNVTNRSIVEKVPLYGVTLSQVNEGCAAGYCYDFRLIGRKAGEQAVSIIRGESAADMPVIMERECTLYVNTDTLEALDMEIPDEYKAAANKVKTSYETAAASQ